MDRKTKNETQAEFLAKDRRQRTKKRKQAGLMPDVALPRVGERVVWYCFQCQYREALTTWPEAEQRWQEHKRQTGHNIGSVMRRVRSHFEERAL
jgi:hypothetical protein